MMNDQTIGYKPSNYVFEDSIDEFINKQIKKFPNYSPQQIKSWTQDHKDHRNSYLEIESNLINQTIDTRTFGNCFLRPEHIIKDDHCKFVQEKLFPWLTFKSPKLTRYDGVETEYSISGGCFLQQIFKQQKGEGIVISAKNSHYQQLVSLFTTLRILNNTLPIQIVHRDDITKSRRSQLIRLARLDLKTLVEEQNSTIIEPLTLQNEYNQTELKYSDYPKLDVSFLNIQPTISKSHSKDFKMYSNKLLATLFTTFQKAIFMDADIILFKSPQDLLKIPEFQEKGAFFFRDRELINRSSDQDKIFWEKLMPTKYESSNFGTPSATSQTLDNRYFHGFTHLVEAGVVLMDRSTHFPGLLHALQLVLWNTATKRVWGDKELFWLSQAISGTENFAFNKHGAGAIGEIIVNGTQEKICSNQPVHVYNDTILWINSGFKFCKNGGAGRDLKHYPGYTLDTLMERYRGGINVSAVIVPPQVDDLYLGWSSEEQHLDHEQRIQGWYNMAMCSGYTYCAVSPVIESNGKERHGTVIKVNEQESFNYNYLGNVWLDANEMSKTIDKNKKEFAPYIDVDV
ncbi:putative alpha-1,3-mannosyltransferase [Wickerhamomyces ciferrii]|uniref:Alpha-1,3-mannosyltransferase n=1 Tax=Wickerhamomyces ciferrii (strain ATCC 14091 / BCRC 22168 / CBS 111 / JCM 3599 / NBRC 0793 / NRRL Y-1031 F-60-10) TaxID=1206466 RepID=K0KFB8_WICCF|nr:putative alpha-1,3-mannosyltransferase [Wickerhamomyces ciferrii]CCH41641.1 putative alpha-1,3-mannosyltransferase [Wickerhamomyces ciferrii]